MNERYAAAEVFVKSCLAISYGTAEEGIRQIGLLRFNETVKRVVATMPEKEQP